MRKLKTGDDVIAIAGKDKGARGKILKVVTKAKKGKKATLKVLVEGLNKVKKHVRPDPQRNQQGGILEREMPMAFSNVAIFNPTTQKADRVGFKVLEDGKKVRVFKSNDEVIDIEG
ncbi:MAG: 50S ribosomal protein L24 [marine bacterium B5-7]|nr:MAG: 50S ribosomal protein L24 [marine bacterium B5-7]